MEPKAGRVVVGWDADVMGRGVDTGVDASAKYGRHLRAHRKNTRRFKAPSRC